MKEVEFKDIKLHHWYWFRWEDKDGFSRYGKREVAKRSKDNIVIRRVIKGSVCGGVSVDLVTKDQIKAIYE